MVMPFVKKGKKICNLDWLILTECQSVKGYLMPRGLGIACIERLHIGVVVSKEVFFLIQMIF